MPRLGALVLAALGIAAAGCDTQLTCSSSLCQDAQTALFCDGTALHLAICRGPGGCRTQAQSDGTQTVTCDLAGARAGDACYGGGSQFGLCVDSANALVCDSPNFRAQSCLTAGCSVSPDGTFTCS